MTFLEFLRLTNTTRQREVKECVDLLTKYDDSECHARFRLSKLTVHFLLSDTPFAILSQHYTIRILQKSWEIATIINNTSVAFFRHHALRPAPTSARRLNFTFWWSNSNIEIILGYKWNNKSILLPNVLLLYYWSVRKQRSHGTITHSAHNNRVGTSTHPVMFVNTWCLFADLTKFAFKWRKSVLLLTTDGNTSIQVIT